MSAEKQMSASAAACCFVSYKLANTRNRAYSPALQAVCSLMSPGKQMPLSEALADLQTRKRALSRSFACVAGGLLVNERRKTNVC